MEQAIKNPLLRLDSLKVFAAWRGAHREMKLSPAAGLALMR
jgi:hypothetical protein